MTLKAIRGPELPKEIRFYQVTTLDHMVQTDMYKYVITKSQFYKLQDIQISHVSSSPGVGVGSAEEGVGVDAVVE